MSNQGTVLVERDGDVGIITLNRPESRNAINYQLGLEFGAALQDLDEDADIHVIVVTGAGDRAFSAGHDIKESVQLEQSPETRPQVDSESTTRRLAFGSKPTIAAINGVAAGQGAEWATHFDLRIGCERSAFRFVAVTIGRINSTWTLPLIVGLPKAREYLFTGQWIQAEEALSVGLLNHLVPSEQLMEETLQLAHVIAGNPPHVVSLAKELVNGYVGMRLTDMRNQEREAQETKLAPPPASVAFKDFLDARSG